jgi:Arc/MetJ-type ribon-helix-helix transcriptional regulator
MRLHISLDDALVAELDSRVGPRDRSRFIEDAVRLALDQARRADALEAALGSVPDAGHEWDDDPAGWVREQRRNRVG